MNIRACNFCACLSWSNNIKWILQYSDFSFLKGIFLFLISFCEYYLWTTNDTNKNKELFSDSGFKRFYTCTYIAKFMTSYKSDEVLWIQLYPTVFDGKMCHVYASIQNSCDIMNFWRLLVYQSPSLLLYVVLSHFLIYFDTGILPPLCSPQYISKKVIK